MFNESEITALLSNENITINDVILDFNTEVLKIEYVVKKYLEIIKISNKIIKGTDKTNIKIVDSNIIYTDNSIKLLELSNGIDKSKLEIEVLNYSHKCLIELVEKLNTIKDKEQLVKDIIYA